MTRRIVQMIDGHLAMATNARINQFVDCRERPDHGRMRPVLKAGGSAIRKFSVGRRGVSYGFETRIQTHPTDAGTAD
jgi:hypothetical protein